MRVVKIANHSIIPSPALFNPAGVFGDIDHDGLTNLFEHWYGLRISNANMENMASTIGVMVVGTFNTKSPAWYYISLVAATFGLTISALKLLFPPMDKDAKIKVDGILLIASVVGFVSWLKIMKEPKWSWKQFLAQITTTIEFFLALGGIISLGINLYKDYQEAYGGS